MRRSRKPLTPNMIKMLKAIEYGCARTQSGKYPAVMFQGRQAVTYRALYRNGLVSRPIDDAEGTELTDKGRAVLNHHRVLSGEKAYEHDRA